MPGLARASLRLHGSPGGIVPRSRLRQEHQRRAPGVPAERATHQSAALGSLAGYRHAMTARMVRFLRCRFRLTPGSARETTAMSAS